MRALTHILAENTIGAPSGPTFSMTPYASWTLILLLAILCALIGWIMAQVGTPEAQPAQTDEAASEETTAPQLYDWAEDEGFLVDRPFD